MTFSPTAAQAYSEDLVIYSTDVDDPQISVSVMGTGIPVEGSPGTLKWTFESVGQIHSSPTIGSDGTIYFGNVPVAIF